MTSRRLPLIGITCTDSETEQEKRPPRTGQNLTYIRAVARAGAAPLLIPNLADPDLLRALYDGCDGLLLSGGPDIDPARYGQARHEKSSLALPERDEAELVLACWAMDDGKPLLAICRGIQVLNVALGGSLYQDIADQVPGAARHDCYDDHPRDYLAHVVSISPQSRLAGVVGPHSLQVNSLHHQALQAVAAGLHVVAHAPDGIVEGVESPDHPFALGVQWHPEELAATDARAWHLFEALVTACQK
jgi:putative glutamine amidotransferase